MHSVDIEATGFTQTHCIFSKTKDATHPMKALTYALSAVAFSGTLFATIAASAAPASIAHQAYRGELPGIPGYQQLELGLNSRNISVNDIIEAAGEDVTPELHSQVRSNLRTVTNFR